MLLDEFQSNQLLKKFEIVVEGNLSNNSSQSLELVIRVTRDSLFGPVLMFKLGGTWPELLKDESYRVIPINKIDAEEMIKEIKGYSLLTGTNSQSGVDTRELEDLLIKVSNCIQANPQIVELELNPVLAYSKDISIKKFKIETEDHFQTTSAEKKNEQMGALEFLFYPRSVVVAGASNNQASSAYGFIEHLINYNFKGRIYPVSSKNSEVLGIKAYPDLDSIPESVDHVIYCQSLESFPAFLESARKKNVKSIHVYSARGAETGRAEAKELETKIKRLAKEYGIRLLGPNCMGVYCPESGFSFCPDFSKKSGDVGAIIQSGGSSTDICKYGVLRGIGFSKLVSYGNAIDINEMDLLKYLADDPRTRVIIMFIEGLRGDSRDFLELLRQTTAKKPVIICKGGLSNAGARATLAHTASLAGSPSVWNTAVRQAGAIPARDIDDLVNYAVAFSLLSPIKGHRLGTGGSGGGRNTVSVDEWETKGFEIVPLPQSIREEFKKRGAVLWDCLNNPADRSITQAGDAYTIPALLEEMAKNKDYDFICANIAADDLPFGREAFAHFIGENVDGYIKLAGKSPKPFFTIFSERPLGVEDMDHWFWRDVAKMRTRLIEAKVAIFPSVDKAADAVNELIKYYQKREAISG